MIPSNLVIINYHKINNQSDIGVTTRKPLDFERDINQVLESGFTPIGFKDLHVANNLPSKPVIITFDDGYESFYHHAYPLLHERNIPCVVFIPSGFIGRSNDWDVQLGPKKYKHLDYHQIREIASNRVEIGSHCNKHIALTLLSNNQILSELSESKKILEDITGIEVLSISYPFGKYNQAILDKARLYYHFGVKQWNYQNSSPPELAIERINIYRMDSYKVIRKKINYRQNKGIVFRDWLLQQGALATIGIQRLKLRSGVTEYEFTGA